MGDIRHLTRVPDTASTREGRDLYLAENGFSVAGYTDSTFVIRLLGVNLRFPNPKSRQVVVSRHDLHHVATGYGTDLVGEAEIGAWEIRAGCNTFTLYFLNGMAALGGLFFAPRRTVRAFRAGRGHTSLYLDRTDYESLLALPVGELRRRLGIAPGGVADHAPRRHPGPDERSGAAGADAKR